ncbi:MAG: Na+/H+ antiporter NhaC [Pseudomonadales bacterium]
MREPAENTNIPPLFVAVLPMIILVVLLSFNVMVYRDNALSGSNQMILLIAAAVTVALATSYGHRWLTLLEAMVNGVRVATPSILILLMVGALAGTWLVGGIVPTIIYYGIKMINPTVFLPVACITSALVAVATGSSWSTSATVGIALIGIGKALGLDPAIVAGAILSGAYFGDKMSPLSDTTNLAAAVGGTDLFTHIRYMSLTTGPSFVIALTLFVFLGFGGGATSADVDYQAVLAALDQRFNINPLLMIVPIAVVVLIIKKVPALPAIVAGVIMGAVAALIFQYDIVLQVGSDYGATDYPLYVGIMQALVGDVSIPADNPMLDELLTSGGMAGMLNTIWLIIAAMLFGGAMEGSGFLRQITAAIIQRVHSAGGLIASTAATCLFTNATASDQYLSIVVAGKMFSEAYEERGLASKNLSRTLEDAGTVTSVLIPWNTCGAYHASVLGVATLSYAPFAFFCLISPLMTIMYATLNFKIARLDDDIDEQEVVAAV